MPVCSVIGCSIRRTPNQPPLTIHRIPRNEHKKKKWLEAIGMENIKPNVKNLYICSLHFDDKCFNRTLDVTRLRDDAMPLKFVRASTSATTSQEKDARVKKRKGSLPEAKTIIKSVFNYLQTEYENFKTFTGGSCDLSPLENILGRTAAAIGVSEDEITAVLDERGSDDSSDESSSKRARVSRDNYDGSISPIEEDSSEEKADEAQPDNRESTFEAEENLIETLKVEIDENVEYHSKPNTGILFQTPFTREQMSVLHQSLSLTEPTHAEVKQEPADVEEQQKMSVCHHTSLTEPTHAEVKQELVDVKEQQRLKQMELSDDVEYTGGEQDPLGDTEYPSSPTMQVGRLPD